jgi:NADH dehydrogenase [ubiquinone] 1 alpha subcomplex assembly factor 1
MRPHHQFAVIAALETVQTSLFLYRESMNNKLVMLSAALLTTSTLANATERMIFDFKTTSQNWFVINDGVMSGISSSATRITNGVLEFSGRVRLENNGGFASARSPGGRYDLSAFDGVVLRVRGDGGAYQFTMAMPNVQGSLHQFKFETQPNMWQEVRVPFSKFAPIYFSGRRNPVKLELDRIETLGFLVANKKAEVFKLEVDSIRAYSEK